jgi:hypothetical protein
VRSRPPTARSRGREYPGLGQGQAKVQYRHVPRLYPVRFHSPLRRRPDAATWTIARDVSQWMEPDVRPLGRAATTFIMEKTCRLSIPLTGDVPPRAFNVSCPLGWQAASRPSYRRRACPVHCHTVRPCCEVYCVHHHLYVTREASTARRYYANLGCQGTRRLPQ